MTIARLLGRPHYWAAGLIACFVALFLYSVIQLAAINRVLHQSFAESNLWATMQADREANLLRLALSGIERRSTQDIALRFEILYSRVDLLTEGPQRGFFDDVGLGGEVDAAMEIVAQLDGALHDGVPAPDIEARLAELSSILRDMANRTFIEERMERNAYRFDQIAAIRLLVISVAGAFLAGLAMAMLLVRSIAASEAARAELDEIRAGLELTVADRTRDLEEALRTETRAKNVYKSFIYMVSHQFRTPVSVIDLVVARLLRGRGDVVQVPRGKLQRIHDAAQRLDRLLSRFLESTDMRAELGQVSLKRMDFRDPVRAALSQVSEHHPGRLVYGDLAAGPLEVEGDAVLLEQMVLNLVENALKYSGPSEPVRVEAGMAGGEVFLKVSDMGIGIAPEAQDAVFEEFYRAPSVQNLPGAGVGLALVRDIVTLHSGHVRFSSTPGRGTTLTVLQPAYAEALDAVS